MIKGSYGRFIKDRKFKFIYGLAQASSFLPLVLYFSSIQNIMADCKDKF